MNDKIQLKRGTLANWLKADPILMDGEMALVATDASKPTVYDQYKVGGGSMKFSQLPYQGLPCLQELGDSTTSPMSQKAVTDWINKGYQFRGIATPSTNPGTPDGPVFYLASEAGTYSNFNGISVADGEAVILLWNGGAWTKKTTGLATEQEIIYDVSARNDGAVFESLQALLSSSNLSTLIPTSVRHGGMSIRFIQGSVSSSGNKYVQYRLMSNAWSTVVADWQGVDDVPTVGSDNLVKSGGVLKEFTVAESNFLNKNLFVNKQMPDILYKQYIVPSTGELANTGYGLFTSNEIEIDSTYKKIALSLINGNSLNQTVGYRFLDSEKNLLSYDSIGSGTYLIVDIPANARYFQFSERNSNLGSIILQYDFPSKVLKGELSFNDISQNVISMQESIADVDYVSKDKWIPWFVIEPNFVWSDQTKTTGTIEWMGVIVPIKRGSIATISNTSTTNANLRVYQLNSIKMTNNAPLDLASQDIVVVSPGNKEVANIVGNYLFIRLGYRPKGESSSNTLVNKAPIVTVDGIDITKHHGMESYQKSYLSILENNAFMKQYNIGNLFNVDSDEIIIYQYIHPETGVLTSTDYNLNTTPAIPLKEGETVICFSYQTENDYKENHTRGWRFLDSEMNVLSFGGNEDKKNFIIPIPEQVNGVKPSYFQISYSKLYQEFLVLSYGVDIPSSYLFYGNQQKGLLNFLLRDKFVLPDNILFAKNKNIGIYFNAITSDFVKECPKFVSFNSLNIVNRTDKAIYTRNTSASEETMTVSANSSTKEKIMATVNKKVIDGSLFAERSINVLAVGDSYTEMGSYLDRIGGLAQEDGISINWIGLMNSKAHLSMSENQTGGQLKKAFMQKRLSDSATDGAFCEGTTFKISVSGLTIHEFNINYGQYTSYKDSNNVTWWIKGYKIDDNGDGVLRVTSTSTSAQIPSSGTLTKLNNGVGDSSIAYQDAEMVNRNPFWDEANQTFSFNYYVNKWNLSSPDILLFMFWNGLSTPWDVVTNSNWVQTDFIPFVEKFHLEYPNAKVIYSLPPFGATINSYKDVDGVKYGRQRLFEKLVSACSELDYVQICPSFIFVDSENGFNTTEVVVNSVYPDYKPNIPNESQFVHPNDGGMYEIGNAVYPYILNTL